MSPRTLSPRLAYALVAAVIGLALFASSTPSPLYATYRELWGFSPVVLTLVYATYAFGVLLALLLAGRVSDEWGRRPVLLVALGRDCSDRRCVHGRRRPSRGCSSRAGSRASPRGSRSAPPSAAMLDLHPRRDPAGVGLTNGVVSAGGMGLGVLVSSTLVEFAPAPRVLPYVALFTLFAIAFAGALLMPEPVRAARARGSRRSARAIPPVGAAAVPARRARRDLLVVDRRPVPLARPAAVGRRCSTPPTTS